MYIRNDMKYNMVTLPSTFNEYSSTEVTYDEGEMLLGVLMAIKRIMMLH